jgi:hypothetical protein
LELYGLIGKTHGWGKVLTVMSPAGRTAALAAVEAGDDVIVQAGADRLTVYQQRRAGGLDRLIVDNGITLLTKAEWDAKKAELGAGVLK